MGKEPNLSIRKTETWDSIRKAIGISKFESKYYVTNWCFKYSYRCCPNGRNKWTDNTYILFVAHANGMRTKVFDHKKRSVSRNFLTEKAETYYLWVWMISLFFMITNLPNSCLKERYPPGKFDLIADSVSRIEGMRIEP